MNRQVAERFSADGFVVARGVLEAGEIESYVARLQALAGDRDRWTLPDGVNRHPDFWPLIDHPRVLAAVRAVLGPDVRYLPHNDLHVGFSSFSWHRDSVNRESDGPDWDESREPYRIVRVGLYLQRFADSQFKLGLVPGSHRRDHAPGEHARRVRRRAGAVANVISGLSGIDFVGEDAIWVATEPGDCVIFDPRVLHTGSTFHGEKYSIFLAYGIPNTHFRNHWHYYLHLRSDLGYGGLSPELSQRLEREGLLAEAPPADLAIDGAWLPSATFTYVARRFK